ncbi:hypothetical protein [Streptomyces sp. JJ36]|uniref:hypothetical protein n=1 Tax=Streptomyces sp. JJ36 TaxID=2736645 RepID=UPI001F1602F1|nr:hypothetical protein [Streptomyces sp. JJ36]MCF6526078.1 hypothetical protein [Streptomyces sp. JJ36]
MNGYAALHEPASEAFPASGDAGVLEVAGTVHAARTDASGREPAPYTLCGLDTNDLERTPGDRPADPGETWYPAGRRFAGVCAVCDRAAVAGGQRT